MNKIRLTISALFVVLVVANVYIFVSGIRIGDEINYLERETKVLHEQNVVPGRANRILSRMVKKIAVSFKESREYFPADKTMLTGCPCRTDKRQDTKEALITKFSLLIPREHMGTIFIIQQIILSKPL